MEEKKLKFELSKVALIFVILFGLCVLIWAFILGVWIGTKIGGKGGTEEVAMNKKPEISTLTPQVAPKTTNETANTANESGQSQRATTQAPVNQTETKVAQEVKPENATKEVKKEVVPAEKNKREAAPKTAQEEPQYKKKEVAHLATKIKEEPTGKISIQIGAFSHKERAEQLKTKISELGYSAEVKEVSQEGKTLYKVYLGRFGSKEEAEKVIPTVKNKLAIEKPFIVELK